MSYHALYMQKIRDEFQEKKSQDGGANDKEKEQT